MVYRLIFTIARMNPPTPGHFELIRKMFEEAILHNLKKIHIILSSKRDNIKNPLYAEEKKYILEKYGIPWIKSRLKSAQDIEVEILMTHEYNRYHPNDIWSTIRHLFKGRTKGDKVLFITGDTMIPFDKSVDILLYDRKKNPISGTLLRSIGWLSLPSLSSIYQPFGLSQKEVYVIYRSIRSMNPPTEENLKAAIEFIRERYSLRKICSPRQN
jgi:hypothetical protein